METEKRKINFIEVTAYFTFIFFSETSCFQIAHDNNYYGVDFNYPNNNLFETKNGIFVKKPFRNIKQYDIFFYDKHKVSVDDIFYLIDNTLIEYIYWNTTNNMFK